MNPFHNNRPPPPLPPHMPTFLHSFPSPSPVPTQKVTLFIKNLPSISKEEIIHYFVMLGALEVRLMDSKKMKNSGFIDLPSLQIAQNTIHYLENNLWYGVRVKASISKSSTAQSSNNNELSSIEQSKIPQLNNTNKSRFIAADDLTKFEPISTKLGINYPSNPDLKYKYPDPTPQTLTNIAKAMVSVPNLYTQVLHLMNKMNLPPPFEVEFPDSNTVNTQDIQVSSTVSQSSNNNEKLSSSDEESEIEVDDDDDVATKVPPPKRIKSWAPERNPEL